MKTIKPFSNGNEFEQWDEKNCQICKNSKFYSNAKFECHIDYSISIAALEYGDVKESIINLIGFDDRHFLKDCPFKDFQLIPVKINTSVFKQIRLKI